MWCSAGAKKGLRSFSPPLNLSCSQWVCSYSCVFPALSSPLFLPITLCLGLPFLTTLNRVVRRWTFCLTFKKKKKGKTSCQWCEHTDAAMLNLTAAWRRIPDTSDNNFTTGFQTPLQCWDRLTFTTRFWLELTWARTGPWGKATEWGLNWPDRRWLCLMLVCQRHRWTNQPQPDLFVHVCSGKCVVLAGHGAVSCICVWMHTMQLEGR